MPIDSRESAGGSTWLLPSHPCWGPGSLPTSLPPQCGPCQPANPMPATVSEIRAERPPPRRVAAQAFPDPIPLPVQTGQPEGHGPGMLVVRPGSGASWSGLAGAARRLGPRRVQASPDERGRAPYRSHSHARGMCLASHMTLHRSVVHRRWQCGWRGFLTWAGQRAGHPGRRTRCGSPSRRCTTGHSAPALLYARRRTQSWFRTKHPAFSSCCKWQRTCNASTTTGARGSDAAGVLLGPPPLQLWVGGWPARARAHVPSPITPPPNAQCAAREGGAGRRLRALQPFPAVRHSAVGAAPVAHPHPPAEQVQHRSPALPGGHTRV